MTATDNDSDTDADGSEHSHHDDHGELKKVEVTVDEKKKKVRPGTYLASDFKTLVGVAADRDLDQIIDGVLTPLGDNDHVTITGGEVFASHERKGGSS